MSIHGLRLKGASEGRMLRSQKARGINAIHDVFGGATSTYVLLQSVGDVDAVTVDGLRNVAWAERWFARPCPVSPQHGFVDSRPLPTTAPEFEVALRGIWAETVAADPDGELLLVPFVDADWSAYVTDTTIGIGPGNEGATSGHDSMAFGIHALVAPDGVRDHVAKGESPFIELVHQPGEDLGRVVQIRSGPVLPRALDYVPRDVVVSHVEEARGDLLEWAKIVPNFGPGTAVSGVGKTLGSHYGVWCKNHGVPFVTTRPIAVGDRLAQTSDADLGRPKPSDVARWAAATALESDLTANGERDARLMLFGLHNFNVQDEGPAGRLLGVALGSAIRLLTAAALGESRHYRHCGKGSRSKVYRKAFSDPGKARAKLAAAVKQFDDGDGWAGGYGGKKWAVIARATAKLWNAATSLAKAPTEANLKVAIDGLNTVVNLAHNGGWIFDKFVRSNVMDQAAEGSWKFYRDTLGHLYGLSRKGLPQMPAEFLRMRALRLVAAKPKSCTVTQVLQWAITDENNVRVQIGHRVAVGGVFDEDRSWQKEIDVADQTARTLIWLARMAPLGDGVSMAGTGRKYGVAYRAVFNATVADGETPIATSFNAIVGDRVWLRALGDALPQIYMAVQNMLSSLIA